MYLLDTNIISEQRHPGRADPRALAWFDDLGPEDWWVSVITDYELELGLVGMRHRDARQASFLGAWLSKTRRTYEARMLPVTHEIGRICAMIQVPDRRQFTDALIAATALHHDLTVVTRNEKDFNVPGLRVFNPFGAES